MLVPNARFKLQFISVERRNWKYRRIILFAKMEKKKSSTELTGKFALETRERERERKRKIIKINV